MKKIVILLSFVMLLANGVSAQKWLDKTLKKVDSALNEVDKFVGNPSEKANTAAGYESAMVKSFSTSVDFVIESCIFDGKMLIINYSLNNRGKQLEIGKFGGGKQILAPTYETKFYDNLGNVYNIVYISAGTKEAYVGDGMRTPITDGTYFTLPEDVKINGTIGIFNFNSKATSIKSATIAGYVRDDTKTESTGKYTEFCVSLKNVPVYTSEQILSKSKTLFKKENPTVASQSINDCLLKSVVVTEKNTQVNLTYLGSYMIYTGNVNNIYITANGKRYEYLAAYGIATRKGNYNYTTAAEQNFTLVFDKIPETTEAINVQFDDWSWTGLRLKEPAGLNIPKTKCVMSLDDDHSQYDSRKRITAAERTALKISSLKCSDYLDAKTLNSNICFGKEIYKDDNCRLLTLIYSIKGGERFSAAEFLVSYDKSGDVVDCVQIGNIYAGGYRSEATVEGNTVTRNDDGIYYKSLLSAKVGFHLFVFVIY